MKSNINHFNKFLLSGIVLALFFAACTLENLDAWLIEEGILPPDGLSYTDLFVGQSCQNNIQAGDSHFYRLFLYNDLYGYVWWDDIESHVYGSTADVKVGVKKGGSSSYTVSVSDTGNYQKLNNQNPMHRFNVSTSGYYIIEVYGNSGGSYIISCSTNFN